VRTLTLAALLLLAMQARADYPVPLPPPVPVPVYPMQVMPPPAGQVVQVFVPIASGPAGSILAPTGYYRPSAYEHWQYRTPNDFGQWRPRVLYYRGRAWYAYDGTPYPAPHSVPGVFHSTPAAILK
jgi:hypothetical protein